jgi:hypothetical protein
MNNQEEARARIIELLWAFSCDAFVDPKVTTDQIIEQAKIIALSELQQQTDAEFEKAVCDILEREQENSECPECDSFHPFKSVQPHSYSSIAHEIAQLSRPDMVSKCEMFEFAVWITWLYDVPLDKLEGDNIHELYEQFKQQSK